MLSSVMHLVLLCLVVLVGVSAHEPFFLGLNDICKHRQGVWKCKSLSDCSSLTEIKSKGQIPDVGIFQGREPIIWCPPSTQVETDTTATTQRNPQTTSKPPHRWTTNRIHEEEGPVWGGGATKPSINTEPTTNKPKHLTKSKAEQKCEEYARSVYRIEESPVLLNQKQDKIKIDECIIQTRIDGSVNAMPKEFPHMAMIGDGKRPRIKWFCAGSLISPKFVLTAAHCTFTYFRGITYWVRLGDLDISTDYDEAKVNELKVKKIIIHPDNDKITYQDIALLELDREVKFNSFIRPICLYTGSDEPGSALASDWGDLYSGDRGLTMLQKVNLTIVSKEKCYFYYSYTGEIYEQQLINNILCVGGQQGKGTCQGDSGVPLQVKHKDVYCMYSQIGVLSFGSDCASTYPDVYTRVSTNVEWIEGIVWP